MLRSNLQGMDMKHLVAPKCCSATESLMWQRRTTRAMIRCGFEIYNLGNADHTLVWAYLFRTACIPVPVHSQLETSGAGTIRRAALCKLPGRAPRFRYRKSESISASLQPRAKRSSPDSLREWYRTLESRPARPAWSAWTLESRPVYIRRTSYRALAWPSPPMPSGRTAPAQAAPPTKPTPVPAGASPSGVVPTETLAPPDKCDDFRRKK